MKNKRTIYLIVGLIIAAIAAYFLYKQVQHLITMAIRGAIATKVVDKVANTVADRVTDEITDGIPLPGFGR